MQGRIDVMFVLAATLITSLSRVINSPKSILTARPSNLAIKKVLRSPSKRFWSQIPRFTKNSFSRKHLPGLVYLSDFAWTGTQQRTHFEGIAVCRKTSSFIQGLGIVGHPDRATVHQACGANFLERCSRKIHFYPFPSAIRPPLCPDPSFRFEMPPTKPALFRCVPGYPRSLIKTGLSGVSQQSRNPLPQYTDFFTILLSQKLSRSGREDFYFYWPSPSEIPQNLLRGMYLRLRIPCVLNPMVSSSLRAIFYRFPGKVPKRHRNVFFHLHGIRRWRHNRPRANHPFTRILP